MNELTRFAVSAQQLRAEATFRRIRDLLAEKGIEILVLKGPHLGATIYDSPQDRLYTDLDLLVRPRDFQRAVNVLLDNGFCPHAYDLFAIEIQDDFKHWEFRSPWGVLVELHRWLSGHDRFAIDIDELFKRAENFAFGETPALGLGTEDLLLHLCLHMGTSYFKVIERKHVADIALLLARKSIDWPVFLRRAKAAGAMVVSYFSLAAAARQQDAVIPDAVMKRLRPGLLRRMWIGRYIDPGSFPICRLPDHSLKRIKRNLLLPLLDKPSQWWKFLWRVGRGKWKTIGGKTTRRRPI